MPRVTRDGPQVSGREDPAIGRAGNSGETRLIGVVTPCFNEEGNVEELARRIDAAFSGLPRYRYELIFIDNCSTDSTVDVIKNMAAADRRIKLIVNARNFGHVRSPFHALLQSRGEAVISLCSDLQEPPELIPEFLELWRRGHKVVAGIKEGTRDSRLMWIMRSSYYRLAHRIADVHLLEHFTGFGLYDRSVVELLRGLGDPYPYTRGLISELGVDVARVPYTQPSRLRGVSKNNFYTLYDVAMLGITSHSKLPLRVATMAGFALSALSLLVSVVYLLLKLMFWQQFQLGTAPLLIGVFFFSSVQLFFIGLLGEYVAAIHTRVLNRPLVVEKERVNFDEHS
jgi:polyisoprenyl-phosphate glycosyltransferase